MTRNDQVTPQIEQITTVFILLRLAAPRAQIVRLFAVSTRRARHHHTSSPVRTTVSMKARTEIVNYSVFIIPSFIASFLFLPSLQLTGSGTPPLVSSSGIASTSICAAMARTTWKMRTWRLDRLFPLVLYNTNDEHIMRIALQHTRSTCTYDAGTTSRPINKPPSLNIGNLRVEIEKRNERVSTPFCMNSTSYFRTRPSGTVRRSGNRGIFIEESHHMFTKSAYRTRAACPSSISAVTTLYPANPRIIVPKWGKVSEEYSRFALHRNAMQLQCLRTFCQILGFYWFTSEQHGNRPCRFRALPSFKSVFRSFPLSFFLRRGMAMA